jgi:hypothetical protein
MPVVAFFFQLGENIISVRARTHFQFMGNSNSTMATFLRITALFTRLGHLRRLLPAPVFDAFALLC